MKLPVSQLKSRDLESLFRKSSIMERHFFPREVPAPPNCLSLDKEASVKNSVENIKNKPCENEDSPLKDSKKESLRGQ